MGVDADYFPTVNYFVSEANPLLSMLAPGVLSCPRDRMSVIGDCLCCVVCKAIWGAIHDLVASSCYG